MSIHPSTRAHTTDLSPPPHCRTPRQIDCGCLLPPALADGKKHRVRFTNAKGKVQVAGVVIW